MQFYILFFILLISSCTQTVDWNAELKDCSFEFCIEDELTFVEADTTVKKYLFMRNLDNSSVTYNFICDQPKNVFSAEVVSGEYFVACYLLVSKTVGSENKFYTQAYYVNSFLLSPDSKNQKNIMLAKVEDPFKSVFCDGENIALKVDLSYDFFQIYKISAVSLKSGGKNKSYSYYDNGSYYFENIYLKDNKLVANLSYSVKSYYDKDFLLSHDVKLTTTRIENLNIFNLIE